MAIGIAVALAACGGNESASDQTAGRSAKSLELEARDRASRGWRRWQPAKPTTTAVSAPGLAPSDQSLDRKIIQNTSMDLQVEDVSTSYQKVATIALDAGGFVLDSSVSANEDRPQANLTIRVPASQYESVLNALRGLAVKVVNETSKAEDQTEVYTDLQARLRSAQAVEARYLDLLNRAETIDDVLKVQNYLTPARLEVEQIQGQINLIDKLSSLATISVSLSTEPPAPVASVRLASRPAEGRRQRLGGIAAVPSRRGRRSLRRRRLPVVVRADSRRRRHRVPRLPEGQQGSRHKMR